MLVTLPCNILFGKFSFCKITILPFLLRILQNCHFIKLPVHRFAFLPIYHFAHVIILSSKLFPENHPISYPKPEWN